LYGKREKCSLFSVDNASRFPLPNCQFLTNLNFENSFVILISLAKSHKKLIFEYWLARPFFGGFFFCSNFVVPEVIITFHLQKIRFYHISIDFCNIPRGGPKTRKKCWTLVGFPLVSFHWISKKFRIWAIFTYIIYNIS